MGACFECLSRCRGDHRGLPGEAGSGDKPGLVSRFDLMVEAVSWPGHPHRDSRLEINPFYLLARDR